jgi:hypothetical protein
MRQILIPTVLAAAAALTGCADISPVDAGMGQSAAHMVEAQTYNPNAAANPPVLAPDGGDGQRLINALDAHRKDVPKGQAQVSQPIVFEVGKAQ